MTTTEAAEAVRFLRSMFARCYEAGSDDTAAAYALALSTHDQYAVMSAIQALATEQSEWPSVAQIVEVIREQKREQAERDLAKLPAPAVEPSWKDVPREIALSKYRRAHEDSVTTAKAQLAQMARRRHLGADWLAAAYEQAERMGPWEQRALDVIEGVIDPDVDPEWAAYTVQERKGEPQTFGELNGEPPARARAIAWTLVAKAKREGRKGVPREWIESDEIGAQVRAVVAVAKRRAVA